MDMSYFQKINNRYGVSSKKEAELFSMKKQISEEFEDSLLAFQVIIADETKTVLIMDDSSKSELKKIIAKPDENINIGDIVQWNQESWIIIDKEPNIDIYSKGYMKKCLSSLKWVDSQDGVVESWFTYKSEPSTSVGIQDGRVLTMPTERRNLIIQSNVITQKTHKDRRFIFDGRAWKVVNVDRLKTGLINLIVEEDLLNTNDNLELRIADYWTNIHTYSASIQNGSSVTLQTSDTLQLIVVVKDNDVVSSLPLAYTSSNETIATVDANGLVTCLSEGNATITVSLANHPTVTASILLAISSVVVDNFTINISGADECKVTQMQSYIVTISNNGVVDSTKTCSWQLWNDSETTSTTLATITNSNSASCTIKANSNTQYGFIKLKATCIEDGSLIGVKRIKIRSLF